MEVEIEKVVKAQKEAQSAIQVADTEEQIAHNKEHDHEQKASYAKEYVSKVEAELQKIYDGIRSSALRNPHPKSSCAGWVERSRLDPQSWGPGLSRTDDTVVNILHPSVDSNTVSPSSSTTTLRGRDECLFRSERNPPLYLRGWLSPQKPPVSHPCAGLVSPTACLPPLLATAGFRVQWCLVRLWIRVRASVYGSCWGNFTRLLREGGLGS